MSSVQSQWARSLGYTVSVSFHGPRPLQAVVQAHQHETLRIPPCAKLIDNAEEQDVTNAGTHVENECLVLSGINARAWLVRTIGPILHLRPPAYKHRIPERISDVTLENMQPPPG
jgi:hypothetical protein